MKLYKVYLDEKNITETTKEFVIDKLEGHGWFKQGTVIDLLKTGQVLNNPFCAYANSIQKLQEFIN